MQSLGDRGVRRFVHPFRARRPSPQDDLVESSFECDGGPIECRMDIHVRRMAIEHGRSDGYLTLTALLLVSPTRVFPPRSDGQLWVAG